MAIHQFEIAETDNKLKRVYVMPQKVLYETGVQNSERLLHSKITQSYVGITNTVCLKSENGHRGSILLDFGSELIGGVQIVVGYRISNVSGVKVRLSFGESVSEAMTALGEKGSTNDHSVRDMHIVLTAYNREIYGHTGFRFVYMELEEDDAWIEIAAVRALMTYRDIPYLGSFCSNDERLNQIYDTAAYTVHLNMQDMLWEGIKRDRLVWSGDMYPEMLAIRSVFGDDPIIDDSLRFIFSQNPPNKFPNRITNYALWTLLLLYEWYRFTGRTDLIAQTGEYWTQMIEALFELIHEDSTWLLEEREFRLGFFIDWATKDMEGTEAGTYALFRLALLSAVRLCRMVHNEALEKRCAYYAEKLKHCPTSHGNNQQIAALMYKAGMLSIEETRKVMSDNSCQRLSTFMMYEVLSVKAETVSVACALEALRTFYGAMLDVGATTFWEYFDVQWFREGARIDRVLLPGEYDIHGDNGAYCYTGHRNSLCHGWSASVSAFLAEYVLGVKVLEPGCKTVSVRPDLGDLEALSGTYPTPCGVISVDVRKEDGKLVTAIHAPQEITILS